MYNRIAGLQITALEAVKSASQAGLSYDQLEELVFEFTKKLERESTAANSAQDWADFELFERQAQGM